MQNGTTDLVKTPQQMMEHLQKYSSLEEDPDRVLERLSKKINGRRRYAKDRNDDVYRAATLLEFSKGILLVDSIPQQYHTFAINLSRQLQEEYNCQTVSEKATAELAAVNYVRTLDIQRRLNNIGVAGYAVDSAIKFIAVLSKELDRANRHYLTTIQTLRMMKQVPMKVSIKANTAVIGQNQIVQTNNH